MHVLGLVTDDELTARDRQARGPQGHGDPRHGALRPRHPRQAQDPRDRRRKQGRGSGPHARSRESDPLDHCRARRQDTEGRGVKRRDADREGTEGRRALRLVRRIAEPDGPRRHGRAATASSPSSTRRGPQAPPIATATAPSPMPSCIAYVSEGSAKFCEANAQSCEMGLTPMLEPKEALAGTPAGTPADGEVR